MSTWDTKSEAHEGHFLLRSTFCHMP